MTPIIRQCLHAHGMHGEPLHGDVERRPGAGGGMNFHRMVMVMRSTLVRALSVITLSAPNVLSCCAAAWPVRASHKNLAAGERLWPHQSSPAELHSNTRRSDLHKPSAVLTDGSTDVREAHFMIQ